MPLLTTRAGASAGAYGLGKASGGNSLELLGSATVTNAGVTSYDFNFTSSNYKSILITGSMKSGTSSSTSATLLLLYGANPAQYIYGTFTGKSNPYNNNWTYSSDSYPGTIYDSSGTQQTNFSMFIGSIDQPSKKKAILGFSGGLYGQNAMWVMPGNSYSTSGYTVSGVRIQSPTTGFAVGSRFKVFGVKAA